MIILVISVSFVLHIYNYVLRMQQVEDGCCSCVMCTRSPSKWRHLKYLKYHNINYTLV